MSFGAQSPVTQDRKPANVDFNTVNSNQEGIVLPYISGTQKVGLIWVSRALNVKIKDVKAQTGKSSSTTVSRDYYADLAGLACHGAVDALEQVIVEGNVVWTGFLSRDGTDYKEITIPGYGVLRIYWGTETQTADPTLNAPQPNPAYEQTYDEDLGTWSDNGEPQYLDASNTHPAYRGQCYIVWKQLYFGRDKTAAPSAELVLTRKPVCAWLDYPVTNEGASPLGTAYEWLTNERYGLAYDDSIIHQPSWTATAAAIDPANPANADRPSLYCSPVIVRAQPIRSLFSSLTEYYDGWFRPNNGQIRAGYFPHRAPATLVGIPDISPTQMATEPKPESTGWMDTKNNFQFNYVDRDRAFKEASQTEFNGANYEITKVISDYKRDEPWTITNDNAAKRLSELSRIQGFPQFKGKVEVKRETVTYDSGDLVKITYTPLNLSQTLCRVMAMTTKKDDASVIEIEFVSEPGVMPTAYTPPAASGVEGTDLAATPIAFAKIVELGPELSDGSEVTNVAVIAVRPSQFVYGYKTLFSPDDPGEGPATFDEIGNHVYWASLARLDADYGRGNNDFDPLLLTFNGIDVDKILSQSQAASDNNELLLFLGDEIFSILTVTPVSGNQYNVTVQRARFDTEAGLHKQNQLCYIIPRSQLDVIESDAFYSDKVGFFKLYAYTQREETATGLLIPFKFANRENKPGQAARAQVTGLELDGQGNDRNFIGRDARFAWRINNNTSGGMQGEADVGIQHPFFDHYLVRIYTFDTGALIREERTFEPRYVYTYEKNIEDGNGTPRRSFLCEVRVKDKRFTGYSRAQSVVVSNPAPAVPDFVVRPGAGSLLFSIAQPPDTDWKGYRIYVSTSSPVALIDANKKFDGANAQVLVTELAPGVRHFFRLAAYDSFGTDELFFSVQADSTPLYTADTLPPLVPTGVSLTSSVITQPDGTQQIKMVATWNANTEGDFRQYTWRYRKSADGPFSWVSGTIAGKDNNRTEWIADANVSYDFQVNASDLDGNTSDWTAIARTVSAKDTNPPNAPVWVSASTSFRQIFLSWQKSSATDFSHFELLESAINDIATAAVIRTHLDATSEIVTVPATGDFTGLTRYYWLRAYDTSLNASAASAVQPVTMPGVPVPTGLTLSTGVDILPDGTQSSWIKGVIAAPTFAEFANFTWEVSTSTGAGNFWRGTTTEPFLRIPVNGGVTYYVRVRMNDQSTGRSQYSAEQTIDAARDEQAPAVPTDVQIQSAIASVFLKWKNPSDGDLDKILIFRSTTPTMPTDPYAETRGDSWMDPSTSPNVRYFYALKSRDTSKNDSALSSTVDATPGKVSAANIETFAVGLTAQYNATIALQNDAWTNNSPSPGSIAWNAHTIYYRGAAHSVAGGSTANRYVWWDSAFPGAYSSSATLPLLTDAQFMIATNVDGAHDLAWNAMANALIGTAYIADLAVTNAKIQSLAVDKLISGTIDSKQITLIGGAGAWIGTSGFVAGTGSGWQIRGSGSAEFNDVTVRGLITGSTISIGSGANDVFKCDTNGNIWCGHANYAAAPFKVSNSGALVATNATISGNVTANALAVATTITIGDLLNQSTSILQSYGFVSGSAGYRLRGNGDAEFNNIKIRGGLAIGTPGSAGLYLGSDKLGYFNGTTWSAFINSSGQMYLQGSTTNELTWDGTYLGISGTIYSTTVQASLVTACTIEANTIVSTGFVSGSAGYRLQPTGNAEFNDVTVRGTLMASRMANNSSFFNITKGDSFFPSTIAYEGIEGFHNPVNGVYYYSLIHINGWEHSAGTNDYFGREDMKFLIFMSVAWDIYNQPAPNGYGDTEIIYQKNGGGWIGTGVSIRHTHQGGPTVSTSMILELTGMTGLDEIDIGIRISTAVNQGFNGARMTVLGLNI